MSLREIGERPYIICEDAIKHAGLVLTRTNAATAGNAVLVDTDKEVPMGITVESTYDQVARDGTYLTNQYVPYIREGECDLVLASDNAEIVAGDDLMAVQDGATEDGVVDKLTIRTDSAANLLADLRARVGVAMEPAAALAGATYGTMIHAVLTIING